MLRDNRLLMVHFVIAAALSCMLLFTVSADAAENIASFKAVTGNVSVLRTGLLPALTAKNGDPLSSGDIIRTKSDASAEVAFKDGSLLKISPRSRVDIAEYYDAHNKGRASVKLARGKVEAVVTKGNTSGKVFEIQTPNAICGVRGTSWTEKYDVDSNTTDLYVSEGTVYSYNVSNPAEQVMVSAGFHTSIVGSAPPIAPLSGAGLFSGAVPYTYQGTVAGENPVDTISTQQGTVMATPPPPPPPPPVSHHPFP